MRLNRQFHFLRGRSPQRGAAGLCKCAGTSSAKSTVRAIGCRVLLILCLGAALGNPIMRGMTDERSDLTRMAASPGAAPNLINDLGSWIWDAKVHSRQTCRFWQSFEIPDSAPVVRALLRMAADNDYTLFLDGRQVGRGSDWRILTEYDLTWLLRPGTHVLGVEAFQ